MPFHFDIIFSPFHFRFHIFTPLRHCIFTLISLRHFDISRFLRHYFHFRFLSSLSLADIISLRH